MGIESPMWRARQGENSFSERGEIEGGVRMSMKEVEQSFMKKYVSKKKIALR